MGMQSVPWEFVVHAQHILCRARGMGVGHSFQGTGLWFPEPLIIVADG